MRESYHVKETSDFYVVITKICISRLIMNLKTLVLYTYLLNPEFF